MLKQISLINLFVLSLLLQLYSQGENNWWMVGNGMGFDANYDPPRIITHPNTYPNEAAATLSDSEGNLLLYTDNKTVWNADHQVIENGDGLLGGRSAHKGVLFVPFDQVIYLFHQEEEGQNTQSIYYSRILYDSDKQDYCIDPNFKNILIGENYAEGITAIQSGCGYLWIMVRKSYSKEIHSIKLTSHGVEELIGSSVILSNNVTPNSYQDEFSYSTFFHSESSGRIIHIAFPGIIETYDFSSISGELSNPLSIEDIDINIIGSKFLWAQYGSGILSHDGKMLFVLENEYKTFEDQKKRIVCYDITMSSGDQIRNSKKIIDDYKSYHIGGDDFVRQELTGKIFISNNSVIDPADPAKSHYYIGSLYMDSIFNEYRYKDSVIFLPKIFGKAMNFTNHVVVPTLIEDTVILPPDTSLCHADQIELEVAITRADSLHWSTGHTTPTITVTDTGQYWVEAYHDGCTYRDTINVSTRGQTTDILPDYTICHDQPRDLSLPEGITGTWQDGSVGNSYTVMDTGYYAVQYDDDGCAVIDSAHISFSPIYDLDYLGRDTTLCADEDFNLALSDDSSIQSILWSTDETNTSSILIDRAGAYFVTVTDMQGCSATDSILISYSDHEAIDLRSDTLICDDHSFSLSVDGTWTDYQWSTGETERSIRIDHPDRYSVTVTDHYGCTSSDTIIISIDDNCDCSVYIPDAFYPHSEHHNHLWQPTSNCSLAEYQLSIYDRWGERVYHSIDQQQHWDGTILGRTLPNGVYYYLFSYRIDPDESVRVEKGTVLLMR